MKASLKLIGRTWYEHHAGSIALQTSKDSEWAASFLSVERSVQHKCSDSTHFAVLMYVQARTSFIVACNT